MSAARADATLIGKNGVTVRSNLSRIAALLAASLACCALQARAESMDALYEKAKSALRESEEEDEELTH